MEHPLPAVTHVLHVSPVSVATTGTPAPIPSRTDVLRGSERTDAWTREVGALQLAEDIRVEPDEIDAIRDAEPLRLLAKRAPVVGLAESRRSDQAGPQRTLRKGRREGFEEDMLALCRRFVG